MFDHVFNQLGDTAAFISPGVKYIARKPIRRDIADCSLEVLPGSSSLFKDLLR
jgi:hypothetical protein